MTVTAVAPNTGLAAGGESVTVTGRGLTGTTAVNFGLTPATGVAVVSDTSVTCLAPAGAAGVVDVSVVATLGTGTLPGAYTYA